MELFTTHATGIKAQLKYYKALRKYEENCRKGKGTYEEFAKVVKMHLNLVMPAAKGMHRDHKVPLSLCRKMRISVSQTNNAHNLQYLKPQDNVNKFSFIGSKELEYLDEMCKIWGVSFPPQELIDEHNAMAAKCQMKGKK